MTEEDMKERRRIKGLAHCRRYRAKVKADPALNAKRVAGYTAYNISYAAKIESEPALLERRRHMMRENYRRTKEKMKLDPALRERLRSSSRGRQRRHAAKGKLDPAWVLSRTLRCRLYHAVKRARATKSAHACELVGCTLGELRHYLQKQFRRGMTWANYGKVWEVDHIHPCSAFDLTDPEQQRECFHYTNLQPLTVTENRTKGNSITHPTQRPLL